MSSVESVAWLGKAKSEPVKMSEVDNGTWLGKGDAAKLLKVSTRSLERDAQRGAIARMYLPRQAGEKSARAVYSRADIEALLRVESTQSDRLITKKEACELLDKSTRSLNHYMSSGQLPAHYIKGPAGGREARFDREEVLRLKAEFEMPEDSGTYRERVGLPPILPLVSQKSDNGHAGSNDTGALARIDPEAVKNVANAFEVALRNALQPLAPSPGLERWMDLKAAVEYSGLSRKWLLTQARAGVPWAMNIGTAKNAVWRFRLAGGAK
jgi:predicted DNA-binding transcriptional regulator AlpA